MNFFMPTIYLAGPIDNCTEEEIWIWRNKAILLLEPFICLNPARRIFKANELALSTWSKKVVMGDKADIAASDVLLVHYSEPAKGSYMAGTTMEIIHAFERGKLVVIVTPYEHVSPWIEYHSHYITKHLEDGCRYIKQFFHPRSQDVQGGADATRAA